jgi:hypothetical protein
MTLPQPLRVHERALTLVTGARCAKKVKMPTGVHNPMARSAASGDAEGPDQRDMEEFGLSTAAKLSFGWQASDFLDQLFRFIQATAR